MRDDNVPDPQKQFLFLFTDSDKNTCSDSRSDRSNMQLEELKPEEQLSLEREILSRLERQGF